MTEIENRKLLNHDLRSCLNAVVNYIDIMKEEGRELSDRHKGFLDRINIRSREGIDILNQVRENMGWE